MFITQAGAQMAPVYFNSSAGRQVQPYHITPWQCEDHPSLSGRSEGPLRGDFFCLPFGKVDSGQGIPAHGRTASALWSLGEHRSSKNVHELQIYLLNALKSASVVRQFYIIDGESIIYDRTTVAGLAGAFPFGHHAVLRMPLQESSLLLSTSELSFGMTYPHAFADPAKGEYQSLAIAARFDNLAAVPSVFKETPDANCNLFPARRGFTDLLQIGVRAEKNCPVWSAAVNTSEKYLWFSLRDPELLPSTILWIENGGRHQAPWNGRNCSLGVEDVCSFFDQGSAVSAAENEFNVRGIKTVHEFAAEQTLSIPYLQGVALIPEGFGHVRSVSCTNSSVTLADADGREVTAKAHPYFVFGERW
jgi:hypothetical protein